LGGKFLNTNKIGWGHKKKKTSKTQIEIKVEKGKENKLNLPTTLVSEREKIALVHQGAFMGASSLQPYHDIITIHLYKISFLQSLFVLFSFVFKLGFSIVHS
jgi:hypothetical protein